MTNTPLVLCSSSATVEIFGVRDFVYFFHTDIQLLSHFVYFPMLVYKLLPHFVYLEEDDNRSTVLHHHRNLSDQDVCTVQHRAEENCPDRCDVKSFYFRANRQSFLREDTLGMTLAS